jgi:hypothetical protein
MTQQLELRFFWPLTEQIPLGLNFAPCEEYELEKKRLAVQNSITSGVLSLGNGGIWTTTSTLQPTSFVIKTNDKSVGKWEVTENVFFYRPKKPNYIIRSSAKVLLGWKWIDE